MSLGKHLLAAPIMERLDIDERALQQSALLEAMRIVNTKPELVCRLIAIMCAKGREEVLDEDWMRSHIDFFGHNMEKKDMAALLLTIFSWDSYADFIKESGIAQELKYMRRAQNAKESKNTLTFGGKTMYGALIDRACERYGWTLEYVVWGISYLNLRMLLADSVTSIFLTDEERKKAHIPQDRTFISADDPKNIERLMKITNG